ncbi:MAG: hypothetical protein JW927_18805, partial [Deltaproteobacteria bacterium]|nr:hypothetical protein [Deltaproteobacteria bacterium]
MISFWRMTLFFVLSVISLSLFTTFTEIHAKESPPMPQGPGEPENGKIDYYEPDWMTEFSLTDDAGVKRKFDIRGERWAYQT